MADLITAIFQSGIMPNNCGIHFQGICPYIIVVNHHYNQGIVQCGFGRKSDHKLLVKHVLAQQSFNEHRSRTCRQPCGVVYALLTTIYVATNFAVGTLTIAFQVFGRQERTHNVWSRSFIRREYYMTMPHGSPEILLALIER